MATESFRRKNSPFWLETQICNAPPHYRRLCLFRQAQTTISLAALAINNVATTSVR
jgi:hypothetical protein